MIQKKTNKQKEVEETKGKKTFRLREQLKKEQQQEMKAYKDANPKI